MKNQRGFTLVELAVGIAVISVITAVLAGSFKEWDGKSKAEALGHSIEPIKSAVENYVNENIIELQATNPVISGYANPHQPTTTELKTAGYLSTEYIDQGNLLNANARIAINLTPVGCTSPNCNVSYVVYYDRPWLDDSGFANIKRVAQAAQALGGGYSSYNTPNQFMATDGSWSTTNPLNQAGVLAYFGSTSTGGTIGCASFNSNTAIIGNNTSHCNTTIHGQLTVTQLVKTEGGLEVEGVVRNQHGGSPNIVANANDQTGGGIAISNDGGFYDYNDGYVTFNGSSGLRIAGNNGSGSSGQIRMPDGSQINSDGDLHIRTNSSSNHLYLNYPDRGHTINYGSGIITRSRSGNYALNAQNSSGTSNSQPRNADGSLYVNDTYFRSVNKWASELASSSNIYRRTRRGCVRDWGYVHAYCNSGDLAIGGGPTARGWPWAVVASYGSGNRWTAGMWHVFGGSPTGCFTVTAYCLDL